MVLYGSGGHSAADPLSYANPVNIKVVVYGMQVWKDYYLLASTSQSSRSRLSASGVVYRDQIVGYHHAMAQENGEVLLSAGAISFFHLQYSHALYTFLACKQCHPLW